MSSTLPKQQQKEKKDRKSFNQSLAEWKLSIYNLTTRQCLGHTCKSWGLILLFSLVFYVFLAALFIFTIVSIEIFIHTSDPASYIRYIEDLKKFLKSYALEQKNLTVCPCREPAWIMEYSEQKGTVYVICQFPVTLLACSGMDDRFGYSKGHPCILVKMNRINGRKLQGEPRIECSGIPKGENTTLISLSS
ncbi:LOW QUALITY PROTEIN: sodium/potassium-transporting ATPase subunit beta-3-like [Rhynchonycteris naso]